MHNNIEEVTSKMALATVQEEQDDHESSMELDPFSLFINAIRANQTRRKYQARLNTFFDYISIPETNLEERCKIFVNNCHQGNSKYATSCVFRFIVHLKERMNRKEIVVYTIYNYLKPIKLFCETNEIDIKWKKITRRLPKGNSYADDRIPTDKEIQRLLEYPDRRIKAIVYTMTSSGIRLGAWDYLRWGNIKPIEKECMGIVAAKIIVVGLS